MAKEHQFHSKDHNGNWIVECRDTGGQFSTQVWRTGKVKDQECPCCGGSIKKSADADLRAKNYERFGHASITGR